MIPCYSGFGLDMFHCNLLSLLEAIRRSVYIYGPRSSFMFGFFYRSKIWKTIDNLVHQTVHSCDTHLVTKTCELPETVLDTLPESLHRSIQYIKHYQTRAVIAAQQPTCQPSMIDNDTGVELTHNKEAISKQLNKVAEMMEYMDHSQYDNIFMETKDMSTGTPTNKSALQRRYKILKRNVPKPKKKTKCCQWVKLSDEFVGMDFFYTQACLSCHLLANGQFKPLLNRFTCYFNSK